MRLIALGCGGRVLAFLVTTLTPGYCQYNIRENINTIRKIISRGVSWKNLLLEGQELVGNSLNTWVVPLDVIGEHLRGTKSKSWQYSLIILITVKLILRYINCIFGFLQQFECVGVLDYILYIDNWHLIPSLSLISYPQCVPHYQSPLPPSITISAGIILFVQIRRPGPAWTCLHCLLSARLSDKKQSSLQNSLIW